MNWITDFLTKPMLKWNIIDCLILYIALLAVVGFMRWRRWI